MARRRGWRHTLKKFFSCESEENRSKKEARDFNKWLEKQRNPESDLHGREKSAASNPTMEACSVALATAAAAEAPAAVAQTAAVVVRLAQSLHREKSRESIGENWDDRILSKDHIEENLRRTPNPATLTFMDPNNPRWGRIRSSERWAPTTEKQPNSHQTKATAATATTTTTTNSYVSTKGDNLSNKTTTQSRQSPSSTNVARPERCHRYYSSSTAGSWMRDDVSLYSCPPSSVLRHYMASTESSRAKSRPVGRERRLGTANSSSRVSGSSPKKRLSFSGTPVVGLRRRYSGPPRIEGDG